MKIGSYAKRYNLPISTIRHYIDLGLLTPIKNTTQYEFSQNDCNDMDTINQLKFFGFHLSEVQQYLSMLRLYEQNDRITQEKKCAFLLSKRDKLVREQEKLSEFTARLNAELHNLNQQPQMEASPQSSEEALQVLPLEILPHLNCPSCHQALQLNGSSIYSNGISEGRFTCRCGYSSTIQNGILFTGADENLEQYQDFIDGYYGGGELLDAFGSLVFEIIDHSNAGYLTTFYKSSLWIHEILENIKTPFSFILFPDISIHLLYKYSNSPLFTNKHIIVTALSAKTIQDIRLRLQHLNPNLKITYIVNSDCALPLRPKLIDMLIDYYGTSNLSFFIKKNYLSAIDSYFSDNAILVGAFDVYAQGSKTHSLIKKLYPFSSPECLSLPHLHRNFQQLGWEIQSESAMGSAINPGHYFEYHHPGELRRGYTYYAKKLP